MIGAIECPNPVITVDHLWFAYDDVPVIEDLSFCVSEGIFIGIVGPNGGGKTTLLRLVLGLLRPNQGRIEVFGQPPERLGRRRHLIGYVPQRQQVDWSFPASVREVVAMGGYAKLGPLRWPGPRMTARVEELLELMGMREHAGAQIGSLSVGQQQRVFIARALVAEPRLLILDEPTVGVDSAGRQSFYELILDLKARFGLTVLMVSHDIDQLAHYADQMACLNRAVYWHDHAERLSDEVLNHVYACELDAFYTERAARAADHAADQSPDHPEGRV